MADESDEGVAFTLYPKGRHRFVDQGQPVMRIVPNDGSTIGRLNQAAKDAMGDFVGMKSPRWVEIYYAEDRPMVALKPVTGGDINENAYSAKGGMVSLQGVLTHMGLSIGVDGVSVEGEWDDDRCVMVFDLSPLAGDDDD